MSDDLMTQALKEAYACCPTEVVVLDTLQIDHTSFEEPIRLVNDFADLTAKTEAGETVTYIRFAFDYARAEVNAQGVPEFTVTVDNASAEIARQLDAIADGADPLPVTVRTYRSDDLNAPAGRNLPGEIQHIQISDLRVTLRVAFGQIANKPFPSELFTPKRFPGLVR